MVEVGNALYYTRPPFSDDLRGALAHFGLTHTVGEEIVARVNW